jgi:hypothetical protein
MSTPTKRQREDDSASPASAPSPPTYPTQGPQPANAHASSSKSGKPKSSATTSTSKDKEAKSDSKKKKRKMAVPGIVYVSRVPPGMTPQKVKHLMGRWGEIGKVYAQKRDGEWSLRRVFVQYRDRIAQQQAGRQSTPYYQSCWRTSRQLQTPLS